MNNAYKDITDQLGEPAWWDEHAVPRYCEFEPRAVANIYATECCLLLIACQNCGRKFKVAMSDDQMSRVLTGRREILSELVESKKIHYGDPPNLGCCASGPTMNSEPIRVLEFWITKLNYEWERATQFEVTVG